MSVDLNSVQSTVLGIINKYKCLSIAECHHWSKLPMFQIEQAVNKLERHRLVYLSNSGGLPKRYCPAVDKSKKYADEEEDEYYENEEENYE